MNHFEIIYQLAKAKDVEGLKALLNQGACIDEFKQGTFGLSAAAKLASEKNKEAVRLLQSLGANENYIAYGYGLCGRVRDHLQTLKTYSPRVINWLARGAAQAGYINSAEYLRCYHFAHVDWIAEGAALGGECDYAEYLRTQHNANVHRIARGSAQGHMQAYTELLRNNYGANIHWIVEGAAVGGNFSYIDTLKILWKLNYDWVAEGAAAGGFFEEVEDLRARYRLNMDNIIRGAKISGHLQFIRVLQEQQTRQPEARAIIPIPHSPPAFFSPKLRRLKTIDLQEVPTDDLTIAAPAP